MIKGTLQGRVVRRNRTLGVLCVLLLLSLLGAAGFGNGIAILGAAVVAVSLSVLLSVFVSELRAGPPPMP